MGQDKGLEKKLDEIKNLLEDLFILEACKVKSNKEDLRNILKIDKKRIGRISKLVKT